MSLVVVKINEHNCRAVIATNFTHTFCGSTIVRAMGLKVVPLVEQPAAATSDGSPIEFLGQSMVLLELGPWRSAGLVPLLVCFDCPADMLIGQDLIDEISKTFPVKFEYYKNTVNIGGTRVSMLDPLAVEEKFMTMQVMDPHTNQAINIDSWKKGAREGIEMGGLVKRRVEVVGMDRDRQEENNTKNELSTTIEQPEKQEQENSHEESLRESNVTLTNENEEERRVNSESPDSTFEEQEILDVDAAAKESAQMHVAEEDKDDEQQEGDGIEEKVEFHEANTKIDDDEEEEIVSSSNGGGLKIIAHSDNELECECEEIVISE